MPNLSRPEEPWRFYQGQAMTNKPKIIFAEGCFDNFDGTEEELAAMLADIHQMAESGALFENATPVDETDEEFIKFMQSKVQPRQ